MKKITLLVLIVMASMTYGQNKLLSSINQFDNNGTFENSFGYDYEYDANDNLITEIGYQWDQTTSSWIIDSRESYLYNANGKATQLVYQDYNTTTGNYENDFRDLYTYNSNGDVTEGIFQEFVTGAYQNEFRLTVSYNGSQLSSFIEYDWNGSQWVQSDRGTLTYNSSGTIASITSEEFSNGSYTLDYRDTFTYDSNDRLIQKLFETWNGTSYDFDEQIDYTLDSNGNLITEIGDFDAATSGPNYRETYSYDSSQLMSNIANPFKDKTGLDYIFDDFPFINKVLESTYAGYDSNTMSFNDVESKTIYNYNSTLSIEETVVPVASIKVYPNPTADFIQIEAANFNIDHVDVFGILGNKILSTNKTEVNLSSFPSGIYFLNIYDVNGIVSNHEVIRE